MWESPIEVIQSEIRTEFEDNCLKAVQSYGFLVDKTELARALTYDRKQYEKGYADGYANAIDEFAEALKEKAEEMFGQKYVDVRDIDEIAEQLKGVRNERDII
jgi:hypothetical protein